MRKRRIFFFLAGFAGLLWIAGSFLKEEMEQKQIWILTAQRDERKIQKEEFQAMEKFPKVSRIWTIMEAEGEIAVEGYRQPVKIKGVDLKDYPLTVIKSAGKKEMRDTFLLAAGEGFFDSFTDRWEKKISQRQSRLLEQNLPGGRFILKTGEGENLQWVEFAGIVKETGVYMDQKQLRRWLIQKGIQPEINGVCMQVQGKEEVRKVQDSFEKAGFHVEKRQKESFWFRTPFAFFVNRDQRRLR